MLTVYIEEAHASDEWVLPNSEIERSGEGNIPVHKTIDDRINSALKLINNRKILSELVCDSMENGKNICDR